MPVEFGRIYFDTEPLTQSQWPKVSTSLENAFKLAALFDVELCIPQAVLDERQAQWFRTAVKKYQALVTAHKALAQWCKEFCEVPAISPPNAGEIKRAYLTQTGDVLKRYRITTVPTTSRSAAELYKHALDGVPPFAEKGTGFKDAVILVSILDHLAANPIGKPAIVLTKDTDFDERALSKLAGNLELDLKIYRSVDEVNTVLDVALDKVIQERWRRDRERAQVALEGQADAITAFIADAVPFTEYDFGPLARILEIRGLRVRLIREINTPFPVGRPEGERVTFTCLVEVGVEVLHETFPTAPPRRLKVGETTDEVTRLAGISPIGWGFERQLREITKVVELECRASVEDKEYRDLELVSARRRDDLYSQSEMWSQMLEMFAKQQRGQETGGEGGAQE